MWSLRILRTTATAAVFCALPWSIVGGVTAGWKECEITEEDRWVSSAPYSMAYAMRLQYNRHYTCERNSASLLAASYEFVSPCTARTFKRHDIKSCLSGRRIIFIGDSLAVQQAEAMVGMLGWHPSFIRKNDPRNSRWTYDSEGRRIPNLLECYSRPDVHVGYTERCFDLYSSDFRKMKEKKWRSYKSKQLFSELGHQSKWKSPHGRRSLRAEEITREQSPEEARPGGSEEQEGDDEFPKYSSDEISVHMRMFARPNNELDWFNQVLMNYNETRPSDVYVVNFGAHYKEYGEENEMFKKHTSALLDRMGEVSETATVVWRQHSPTHFPSVNASYDNFGDLPVDYKNNACCTGTPPKLSERNAWVDEYLHEKELTDKIRVLRIYGMSSLRGAAHHSCLAKPPRKFGEESTTTATVKQPGVGRNACTPIGTPPDCLHWSETGVVEEWNKLLLNHLCPA